jgi:hypothetical protein
MNLAKVIFILKRSVELRRYLLSGCVAACCLSYIEDARCLKVNLLPVYYGWKYFLKVVFKFVWYFGAVSGHYYGTWLWA